MSDQPRNEAGQSERLAPVLPVRLEVEYPARLSEGLLFVKWLLVIPLYIGLVFYGIAAVVVGFIAFWSILFTGRFPEGMFDFIRGFAAFSYKTMAYFPLLLTDRWSPDDYHPLDFQVDRPERLSRLVLVFVKLPSYLLGVASGLVGIGACLLLIVSVPAWFIILFSGRYPEPLFRFNVSLIQWVARVGAWQWMMRDDFSLFGATRCVQVPVAFAAAACLFAGLSPWLSISVPGAAQWPGILTTIGAMRLDESRAADTLEQFVEAVRTLDRGAALALSRSNNYQLTDELIACQVFKGASSVRIKSAGHYSGAPGARIFTGDLILESGGVGRFHAILWPIDGDWKVVSLRDSTGYSGYYWAPGNSCEAYLRGLGADFATPAPTARPVIYVPGPTFTPTPPIDFSAGHHRLAKWGSLGSGDGQFTYPNGVAVDAAGNVYATDGVNRIHKFSPGGAFLAKWGSEGSSDGQVSSPSIFIPVPLPGGVHPGSGDGQLSSPTDVAVDSAGNVYVADTGNHRIQVFGPGP